MSCRRARVAQRRTCGFSSVVSTAYRPGGGTGITQYQLPVRPGMHFKALNIAGNISAGGCVRPSASRAPSLLHSAAAPAGPAPRASSPGVRAAVPRRQPLTCG